MDTGILDRLQAIGCNVSVTGVHGFLVRLTLQHDGGCGHTGDDRAEKCEQAIRDAVHSLLEAADGSKCKVDVAELRRIALTVG